MNKAKTVASVSFLDNHSISMDMENVVGLSLGKPMEVEPGQWFSELIIRSQNGTLSVQMLSDAPDRFVVETED
ncbi:MAG TPA: hypothetical protein HPQ04_05820 [Rhodospirillaceae bacterium]|nr:hypothetical protein [Rhodospirillaceae bacterium]